MGACDSPRITRRKLAVAIVGAPVAACAGPTPEAPSDPLVLDDQSRLNSVRVARTATVSGSEATREASARTLLREAARDGRPVNVGGIRHSMGGQALPPAGGVGAVLGGPRVIGRPSTDAYRVGAGATWRSIIESLDPSGISPLVTQSNNDFTVGGAISVNAHGWAVPFGPVGSTVRSLRVMLADGSVMTCSRRENADLFAACIGGYGLFGLLLDAELAATPNLMLDRSQERMPAGDFGARFVAAVRAPDVRMAYGRLNVARRGFLNDAILVAHRPTDAPPERLPRARSSSDLEGLTRRLFRAQTGSEAGKRLRWWAETTLAGGGQATRNSLMNVPVASFAPFDLRRTDILHEYFVPPAALDDFLADCRRIIPASEQDLLNLTLRWVEADDLSLLPFAPRARIALVMLFSQAMTAAAETDMRALTQKLIDAALAAGGSFYLPYRLHARSDQLRRAYPGLEAFAAAKRRWDPRLRFRNHMWDAWFAGM